MSPKKTNKIFLDIKNKNSCRKKSNSPDGFDTFRFGKENNDPVLFSKGKISGCFYTEDSKLYITPREAELLGKGLKLDRKIGKWDCLSSRIANEYQRYNKSNSKFLLEILRKKQAEIENGIDEISSGIASHFSMVRLWNLSIVGAILFGMFSMTMIYKYLGQGAAADEIVKPDPYASEALFENQKVLGDQANKAQLAGGDADNYAEKIIEELKSDEKKDLEKELEEMTEGYPIEKMIPYIAEKDRTVAAFMVAIAKKESNWGKRVPVLEGRDCYNYWGYRGIRKLMGTGGHTCFNSRRDAVDTVSKRIKELIAQDLDTPSEMVVWKCGSDCEATGGQAAADKWISDVNKYFKQISD